jgi:XTP/dITP diphosphohydrolase
MPKLLLATQNRGKIKEIQALLGDIKVELLIPGDLGVELQIEESGASYAENAALKAWAYAHRTGMLTLADDSGLEVALLEGQPGLRSARYAPQPGADDADRRAYLLERLEGKPRPWLAQFRCVVALADPHGRVRFAEGICPGEIIPQERGSNGFGYDPIFLIPELGLTMAELNMEEKNHISHRARAIQALRPDLIDLLTK